MEHERDAAMGHERRGKMKRDIIQIDDSLCNGCGLCIKGCHEGALALVDGKARLISESYCDGLGACLPECPTGAISIVSRDAATFDEEAVQARTQTMSPAAAPAQVKQDKPPLRGCPGSQARVLQQKKNESRLPATGANARVVHEGPSAPLAAPVSELKQWPVQIKLMNTAAPYLDGARLLIAADCAAYSRASFHQDFMRGRITLIGCPKLDQVDYSEKLTAIFRQNEIKSIMVVRMEVPCCGGLDHAVRQALMNCGKMIPWQVVTLATDGSILDE